jgi:hypothetical protein
MSEPLVVPDGLVAVNCPAKVLLVCVDVECKPECGISFRLATFAGPALLGTTKKRSEDSS